MELQEIRRQIDRIDTQLLQLLTDRLTLAALSRKFKPTIADPQREQAIITRLNAMRHPLLASELISELYEIIFKYSRSLQAQPAPLVAFQGEHGAFSELAIQHWRQNAIPIPCRTFAEIGAGIVDGIYDFGILPVENKLTGTVNETNEVLIANQLYIVGALEMPVQHCLLGLAGSSPEQIRKVYSHPQALAQCRRYLKKQNYESVPFYDTAGAARIVAETGLDNLAAIASPLAAQLYNLQILRANIADYPTNTTRFLVLGPQPVSGGTKCTILFSTAHKAGTLYKVLKIFAQASINLTRIESAPLPPEQFVFFLDFLGSEQDQKVQAALAAVQKITTDFKLLGCYNERVIA